MWDQFRSNFIQIYSFKKSWTILQTIFLWPFLKPSSFKSKILNNCSFDSSWSFWEEFFSTREYWKRNVFHKKVWELEGVQSLKK